MYFFKRYVAYLFTALLPILLYIKLSYLWVHTGGLSSQQLKLELPIILIWLTVFYIPSISIFKNAFLSTIPILSLYVLFDTFYHFLDKSPSVDDLKNITLISDFSTLFVIAAVLLFLTTFMPIFSLFFLAKKKQKHQKKFYIVYIARLFFLALVFFSITTKQVQEYILKQYQYLSWTQAKTIKKNGRFSSFIYFTLRRHKAKKILQSYKDKPIDIESTLFKTTYIPLQKRRNIYIVILESFLDPRLIKNVHFNNTPLSETLTPYLFHGDFSHIISSIYGGGTAQSEFEVLTGIPALGLVNSIEFNTLQGRPVSGFLHALKKNGYHTYATIATSSIYYNAKSAYKSLGFDDVQFLEETDDFHRQKNDSKIFDGDLYSYNIKQLHKNKFQQPYVSYLLGMYGHFPYNRNLKSRPDRIQTSATDDRIKRITNQFFYRTEALGTYIKSILSFDPHAIIFVSSDHLPPLFDKTIQYKLDKKTNIALLYCDQPLDIISRYYYDIPRVIFHLLQKQNTKIEPLQKKQMRELYFKILSESF